MATFIHSSLDDLGLDVYEFRVYCHLLRRQGKRDAAYPSIAGMAKVCGIKRDTVSKAIKSLIAKDLIRRQSRQGMCSLYEAVEVNETTHPPKRATTRPVLGDTYPSRNGGYEGISKTRESKEGYPIRDTPCVYTPLKGW